MYLETRKIESAGNLATPRRVFHMATLRTEEGTERVLAMGGQDNHSSTLDSVEELDPETLTWNPAPSNLLKRRHSFDKVVLPRSMIFPG